MWKAVMTLIALILVLIVVRPPENVSSVPVSQPAPMEHDFKNPAYYEYIGNQRFYKGEGKRHVFEAPY
jgi:hypothetical protein